MWGHVNHLGDLRSSLHLLLTEMLKRNEAQWASRCLPFPRLQHGDARLAVCTARVYIKHYIKQRAEYHCMSNHVSLSKSICQKVRLVWANIQSDRGTALNSSSNAHVFTVTA